MGGYLYHLSGYPADFTAAFIRPRTGGVRLVLNLSSAWPAAILQRVSGP